MNLYEFYNEYFLLNLNEYSNIGVDLEITKILFALLVGIIIATVVVNFRRAGVNTVLKKLMRIEAFDEESAKTLDEMGINTLGVRLAARSQGRASKIVRRVGQKEYTYEEYTALMKSKKLRYEEDIDFKVARFYLKKDSLDEAKKITEVSAPTILNTVLICILMIAIFFCLVLLLPDILTLVNNIIEKK